MRVFLDTNILLDILERRAPHYEASQAVLDTCDQVGASVSLAWHSLSNSFYLLAKKLGSNQAQEALREALEVMNVVTTGHEHALRALELRFADLEDALQAAAAEAGQADFLITRDRTGFASSPVPVLSPEEFVSQFRNAT